MTGAPSGGWTTGLVVDGCELDGLGLGVEWVGVARGTEVCVLAGRDVCIRLDDTVGLGVGALERATVGAREEQAAVAPRTHMAPATRPAKRGRPQRLTGPP
jgi:hypothetical protein